MNEQSQRKLSVGDGIRFGIGFILAPAVLVSFVLFFIMMLGSCGEFLTM